MLCSYMINVAFVGCETRIILNMLVFYIQLQEKILLVVSVIRWQGLWK